MTTTRESGGNKAVEMSVKLAGDVFMSTAMLSLSTAIEAAVARNYRLAATSTHSDGHLVHIVSKKATTLPVTQLLQLRYTRPSLPVVVINFFAAIVIYLTHYYRIFSNS